MVKVYYNGDIKENVLAGKTVAVIGYGSQGHAHALNLKESGVDVIVGVRQGKSFTQAQEDGHKVFSVKEAAAQAEIIMVLLPDEQQQKVYEAEIKDELTAGKSLVFAHGFNVHFHQIVPPADVDVFLVAPKGPGHLVRRTYEQGAGVPALFAIYQDVTGEARDKALAYAKGIGGARAGVLETTFIVDLMYEEGLAGMRYSISDTAQWGDFVSGPRVVDAKVKESMKEVLKDIQNGTFAKEWIVENQVNRPRFNAINASENEHQIEVVGRKLREMMPFVKQGKKKEAVVSVAQN